MRALIAGNWKMNGLTSALTEIETIAEMASTSFPNADILICPPATLLHQAVQTAAGRIAIGGQDCHPQPSGAFTGDISAEMLRDAGATAVIVGHSERRQFHCEGDLVVASKAQAAWRANLRAIICVGETAEERANGSHLSVCNSQLSGSVPDGARAENTVIAYEPVWAIGSGRIPKTAEIKAMHAHIRVCLTARLGKAGKAIPILYGGSVKPTNAEEILSVPDVGGALVGGASLKADEFRAIMAAAQGA